MEPAADDPDGTEAAEVVEGASMRSIPLETHSAWIADRLIPVSGTTTVKD